MRILPPMPLVVTLALILTQGLHGQGAAASPELGSEGVSRSSSRQFVVRGKDSRARGAFCVFAEQVKAEFLALLRQHDRWRFAVVIQVRGSTTAINAGRPVRSRVFKKPDGGYRLQIDVELGDAFTREVLREELIRLLLVENILRAKPHADLAGRSGVLPEWLRIGVAEAIEFRRRDRPTELFSAIFKSGKILTVNELIYAKPEGMDSVSRSIYKASCCGLVLALVGHEGGAERMRRMIGDLAVFRGTPKALLEKHFPGTADSKNSLEKWWTLELAAMAQPTVKDILDPLETERALGRCLEVGFMVEGDVPPGAGAGDSERRKFWQVLRPKRGRRGADGGGEGAPMTRVVVDLAEYRQFIDRPDRDKLLGAVEVKLLQLSYRAFPLHRPLIQEYQQVLDRLARGKTRGVDEKLAELAAARVALHRSAGDATDYLNWYEATQVGQRSGAFEDYKEAVEELRKPPPSRADGLSVYLDELDKEFR